MHIHCEIVLPGMPEDEIPEAIESIMARYDENCDDDEEGYRKHAFWDWYVIGGRFAGDKLTSKYDKSKLDEFEQWFQDERITVAGVRFGKPDLQPANQIAKVDAKWNELFPVEGGVMVACPMFAHANDQYGRNGPLSGTLAGDICRLGDSLSVQCGRVLFAGPSWTGGERKRPLECVFMLADDIWNGTNHMPIKWDGTIGDALNQWRERLEGMADGYREQMTPTDDWLTVTVDYHT